MSCSMKSCGATNMQKKNMITDITAITETEDITERTSEDLFDSVNWHTTYKHDIYALMIHTFVKNKYVEEHI